MNTQRVTETTPTRKNGTLPTNSVYVTNVYKTKDHSIFKMLGDNRDINELHVRRLVQSFKENYLISPIIVNEKFQIIDGQHRLEACKETGLPVYYIIIQGYSIAEVQVLNTHQKNWTKLDFLKMYVSQGRPAYIAFQKFMDDFPELDFGSVERLVRLKPGLSKEGKDAGPLQGATMKDFEEGRLKIPTIETSYAMARRVMDYKPYYHGFYKRTFVAALMGLMNSKLYNHKEMIYKCKNSPEPLRIKDTNNTEHYRLQLENIYNYKRNKANKISFKYLGE